MKQYYIPTSSLNFNNIFSTESISPAAFYAQRGFGYSRWTMIPENNVENAILLYDSPRNFTRPASDLEDHPMLVEIRTDEEFPQYADGVFYCDHTIYLNPWNTRVWFFSEKNKITAKSLSDSSLETKLLGLYMPMIFVGNFDSNYSPVSGQHIELNVSAIENDRQINRLKGLLYGYYIGAAKSITPERAEIIHILYVIQDTFAAIAASPSKTASSSQTEVLKNALGTLREQSKFFRELSDIAGSKEKALEIIGFLEKNNIIMSVIKDYDLDFHLHNLRTDNASENYSLKWVRNLLERISNSNINLPNPEEPQIIIDNHKLTTVKYCEDDPQSQLFKYWVNGLFMSPEFNGKISSQNLELATAATLSAKEFCGESWEESPIRIFLNKLRHLVNGEDTDFSWNKDILSEVAAMIYKGDDWDKLLRFMQYQDMYDYRIAFAVYGQLNGFANLTRDFTDILLNQDNSYVELLYKNIYSQLFDPRICEDPMPSLTMALPKQDIKEQISIPGHEECSDLLSEMVNRIAKDFREAGVKEKKNSPLEQVLRSVLIGYAGPANEKDFISFLAQYASQNKTKEPWKSFNKILNAASTTKTRGNKSKSQQPSEGPTLFDENEQYFYCDSRAIGILNSVLAPHQLDGIMWFFDDLRKPSHDRKYYGKVDEKNNKKVIDLFCKNEVIIKVIGAQTIEKLREFLYQTYGIR